MAMVRTIKLKVKVKPEILEPTISAFTKAYNFVCQVGWNEHDTNGVSLHHKTYKTCREYLTADLSCAARTKAVESIKSVKALQKAEYKLAKIQKREPRIFSCPESRRMSVRYEQRLFNISIENHEVSLHTISGRIKVKFEMCEYFKKYLNWRRRSAELFVKDNQVYLHVSFDKTVETVPSNNKFIGIDRGIKKLAVTSDNRFFGGGHVKQVSDRYQRLRTTLQTKKHSGKRHLTKIKCKENRFRRDMNHVISKKIVSTLEAGTTIVLEDLTGVRERTIYKRRKENRREHSSWAYFQLEQFLTYKAEALGISVKQVDARYTSQRCSKCGFVHEGNRTSQSNFKCKKCGFQLNADLNASRNIVNKHLDTICYPGRASQRALCSPETV